MNQRQTLRSLLLAMLTIYELKHERKSEMDSTEAKVEEARGGPS
jgi:hypothetical protein